MLNIDRISYKNKKTWDLIASGNTVGVFQLESDLGRKWAKTLKPTNLIELSALTALIRPSCLESGLTDLYCKIKNNEIAPLKTNDVVVDTILRPSFGILLYQEQILAISQQVAWAHLPEIDRLVKSDALRKSIGKKSAKDLFALEQDFIEGCLINGRSKELAQKIFDLIKKNARYSFNNSHAAKYATIAYKTAYLKANFPLEFYTSYLTYSKLKQKPFYEIRDLINEARKLKINILPPHVGNKNSEFKIIDNCIAYGLSHIKNVGLQDAEIIASSDIENWYDLFMLYFGENEQRLRVNAIRALIACGACDHFNIERNLMLECFEVLTHLSDKEVGFIVGNLDRDKPITQIKEILLNCSDKISVKKRKDIVKSEAISIDFNKKDGFSWRARQEKELIGISMTCSAVNDKSHIVKVQCVDLNKIEDTTDIEVNIFGVLENIRELFTKKGKNPGQSMAIITISDKTGVLKIACFPEEYAEYKSELFESEVYEFYIKGTKSGWCIKNLSLVK